MKTHPCSPCPTLPSPFYKLIPTWMNVKYLIFSPMKRGLIKKQDYHQNTTYFKETDVWSHWHVLLPVIVIISPFFTALSFQPIHCYTLGAPAPAQQPSQVLERQPTYLSFLHHPQAKKTAPLPLRNWEELPKKRAKQPKKWNYNTLEHINHMGPLPRCRLKGDSTKALTLIPIPRSSNARQTTISSAITLYFAWLEPDPERQLLIHLPQYPLLHRAPKSRDRVLIFLQKFGHVD